MTLKSNLELGKVPPQNIKAEEILLASIIVDTSCYIKVCDIIKPDMFYRHEHTLIYNAASNLFVTDEVINMITITKELNKLGKLESAGGAFRIAELAGMVVSSNSVETYAAMMIEASLRRNVIAEASQLLSDAYNQSKNIDDIINSSVSMVDRILKNASSKASILSFGDNLGRMVEAIKESQKDKLVGLKPSFSELREYIREYEPGRLYIIAGRPGMGKSAFVLNEAISFAKEGNGCLFFSLEMTSQQITKRAFINLSHMNQNDLEGNRVDSVVWEEIDDNIGKIEGYPLFIDDTPLCTFSHVKTQSKIYKKKHDIKAIIIDYIGLMGTDMSIPREQQISLLSRQLKALSKEINVPVFLLAQLNRNAEARSAEGFKPKLSDLRESGAIEQDADAVLFPYRPEYYYKEDAELKGKGLIIIEKNRDGTTGEAPVNISKDVSRWGYVEDYYPELPTVTDQGFMSEKPF